MKNIVLQNLQKKLHQYYEDIDFGNRIFNLLWYTLFNQYYQLVLINNKIENSKIDLLQDWITKITEHDMPYQYIIKEISFLSASINIIPPVLIPRPETEYMVSIVTTLLKPYQFDFLSIVDYCAGSGCIGISLLKEFQNSRCTAFDINHQAVSLAAKNAIKNNVRSRYTIYKKDIFTIKKFKKYDIIISNPPYVSWHLYNSLDNSVKQWEDIDAITDRGDGCTFLFFLIKIATKQKEGFFMAIELCQHNAEKLAQHAKEMLKKSLIYLLKDQYGKPRILIVINGKYKSLHKEIIENYELL